MSRLTQLIPKSVIAATIKLAYQFKYKPLERQFAEAARHQREWLFNRISLCRHTQFGRDHGFDEIRSLEDFRRRVPIADYSHFAPYIKAVAAGQPDALIPPSDELVQFTITTGSTGTPKLNPVTKTWLKEYQAGWDAWGIKLFADHPNHFARPILQMAGTWDMGRTPGGYQISMVSALLARRQSPLLRPYYAIPETVNDITDPVARHYTALRLSIVENIGWIILMNPGSLIRLAEIGNEFKESLIRDVTHGTLSNEMNIPTTTRDILTRTHLRADTACGRKLQAIVDRTGQLLPKDYWNQPVIGCWLGGTAGFQSRYLADYFGPSPMRDMGLVSSEGRHTIPLEDSKPEGVPSIGAGYYEFLPLDEHGIAASHALEGHELTEGCDYRLLITNSAGYFRFDIGDTIRCRGFRGQAPLLEFRQKFDRVGDLEGEKVTEHQIVEAAHRAAQQLGLNLGLITGVPRRKSAEEQRYDFLVEISDIPEAKIAQEFLKHLDQELAGLNFLWRARRREGVIGSPRLLRLPPQSWESYMKSETQRRGTGDYQFKHPGLIQDETWIDYFRLVDTIRSE